MSEYEQWRTGHQENLVNYWMKRAETAEAEVARLKQGLYPLTQWTIEQATQLADRIGTSEGSLFVAWINERKRADAAEAQVEQLTRECLDREATETDARERLRLAEERLDKREEWLETLDRAAGFGSLADVAAHQRELGVEGDHETRLRQKRVDLLRDLLATAAAQEADSASWQAADE